MVGTIAREEGTSRFFYAFQSTSFYISTSSFVRCQSSKIPTTFYVGRSSSPSQGIPGTYRARERHVSLLISKPHEEMLVAIPFSLGQALPRNVTIIRTKSKSFFAVSYIYLQHYFSLTTTLYYIFFIVVNIIIF